MNDLSKISEAIVEKIVAPKTFAVFKEVTEGAYLVVNGKTISESKNNTGHFLIGIASSGEEVKKIIQEDQKTLYPPEADLQPFDLGAMNLEEYRCSVSCRASYRVIRVEPNTPIQTYITAHPSLT